MNKEKKKKKAEIPPFGLHPAFPFPFFPDKTMNTSSDFQTYLRLSREVIAEFDHRTALLAYALASWSRIVRQKHYRATFYRSAEELAKDAGGISPQTARIILKKLKQAGKVKIRPGTPEKPKPRYLVNQAWAGEILNPKTSLLAGKEDLERWGYPEALVAVNLEFLERSSKDGIIEFETSKAAEYLCLSNQQVQRAIRILLKDGIIRDAGEKALGRRLIRRFTFVPDSGRKRVVHGTGPDILSQSSVLHQPPGIEEEFPETPELNFQESFEGNTSASTCVQAEELGIDEELPGIEEEALSSEPSHSQSDAEFRRLVAENGQHKESPLKPGPLADAAGRILNALDLRTVYHLMKLGEDQLVRFFRDKASAALIPPGHGEILIEALVLSIRLRTNPAVPSSSPEIRRLAHQLSLQFGSKLSSANDRREEQLKALTTGDYAKSEIKPEQKVKLLQSAVTSLNRIGVPVPFGSRRCPNPPVKRGYITPGSEGWAAAAKYFTKHTETVPAEIICVLIKAAKIPAPPPEGFDPWRYTRAARNLSALFHNMSKIEVEILR